MKKRYSWLFPELVDTGCFKKLVSLGVSPHYPEGSCLIFFNSGHTRKFFSSTGTAGSGALGGAPGFSHP